MKIFLNSEKKKEKMYCAKHQYNGLSKCLECKVEGLEAELRDLKAKLRSVCPHLETHFEDWPDGVGIEVCDNCGMSRYQWEQGESPWIMVDDIPKAREGVTSVRGRRT